MEAHMSKTKLFGMLALALAGFTAACGNDNGTGPTEERFIATLTGASERPTPVTTNTTGTATLTFTNDTTISYAITLVNATGITAAHIHIGGTEVAGGIIAGLFSNPPGVNIANGTLVEGRVTPGNMGTNNLGLNFESLKGLIRGGGAYVNVHSTANPGGVVRGQLMRQ
jgi:hypothetical protein